MKETFQYHKSISNIMVFVLVVSLSILTAKTSAIAENYAPVPKTGQTQSYATGDDGDLQMGVQWPVPRFTDNGDGTVTDNLTSLIWLKNANCFGGKDWWEALDASNNLADGQCGLSDGSIPGDWRLPNARELLSLINYNISPMLPSGHPFLNVWTDSYVSSTTVASRTEAALHVNVVPELGPDGGSHFGDAPKDQSFRGVWPVRGGNDSFVPAPVQETGQTQSYATGDDGDLQMGVQWPVPRFTDNGDGTVTDNLTSLIWLKNANCFGSKDWNGALDVCNDLANGDCGLSDGSIPGEWRLSNIKELRSLIDHGNNTALLPPGHPFTDVQSEYYWSSTTNASQTEEAWHMPVGESTGHFAGINSSHKNYNYRVWPLRGGDAVNQPPEAICKDVTVSTEPGLCSADASIDDGSFDADGDDITLDQEPPGPYNLGDTVVTLTVTDGAGASDTCDATVTVIDEEPPIISSVSANPNKLWPPNHKMAPVNVAVDATDNCDFACQIISVTSNESVSRLGDGNTAPDWKITGDLTVKLRAERSGRGNGRVYTITVECDDSSGNSSTDTLTVTVPHDKGKKSKWHGKKSKKYSKKAKKKKKR